MNDTSFSLIDRLSRRVADQKAKGSKAFTLIELLVVVMIILVLAAMLIPALGRAKYVARKSACASNMRQICMAYSNYANDNDMFYPFNGGYKPIRALGNTKRQLAPYFGVLGNNYSSMDKLFTCPVVAAFLDPYKSYNIWAAANDGADGGYIGDGTGPAPDVYFPDGGSLKTDGYAGPFDEVAAGYTDAGHLSMFMHFNYKTTGGFMLRVGQAWYNGGFYQEDKKYHYYNLLIGDNIQNWGSSRTVQHNEMQPDFQQSGAGYVSYVSSKGSGNYAGEDGSVKEYVMPAHSGVGWDRTDGEYFPEAFRADATHPPRPK